MAKEFTEIIDPVYIGSEEAAVSNNGRFSHMLCVAHELSKPAKFSAKIIYHHVPVEAGIEKPINEQLLSEAVSWIQDVWRADVVEGSLKKKLLIYSK